MLSSWAADLRRRIQCVYIYTVYSNITEKSHRNVSNLTGRWEHSTLSSSQLSIVHCHYLISKGVAVSSSQKNTPSKVSPKKATVLWQRLATISTAWFCLYTPLPP